MLAGDLLFATETTYRPSAGVTETGGRLPHAAVISREYGIPAVLAVKGATRIFSDGEELEVNGTSGRIRRLAGAGGR